MIYIKSKKQRLKNGACVLHSNPCADFVAANFFVCGFFYFELYNSLLFMLGSSFFGFGFFFPFKIGIIQCFSLI